MGQEFIAVVLIAAIVTLATAIRRVRNRPAPEWRRHDPPPFPAPLSADEVAYRIGVAGATRIAVTPVPEFEPAVARPGPGRAATGRAIVPPPDLPIPSVRRRLLRDTGAALAGLAAILLVAVAIWPPAPTGGVLGETGAPGDSPVQLVASATPAETPAPTPPDPTPTPMP